jgi:hypothetical protein
MVSLFVGIRWVSAFSRILRGEQGVDMYPFATSARARHPPNDGMAAHGSALVLTPARKAFLVQLRALALEKRVEA